MEPENEQPLAGAEFVAFDLETTGLSPVACRIVEFGAVRFRLDGTELEVLEQLVDPQCDIPADAMRIHGITREMTVGKPVVRQYLPHFVEFLGPASTVAMAHHAPFDLGFLSVAWTKTRIAPPPHGVVDSVRLGRACVPGLSSYRLEALGWHFRVVKSEAHRALADARLLAAVFRHLVQRNPSLVTVGDLFRLCRPLGFAEAPVPCGFEELAAAIARGRAVRMIYEGTTQTAGWRTVTPLALLESHGRSYLSAYCHADAIEKTYRLDRIRRFIVDEGGESAGDPGCRQGG